MGRWPDAIIGKLEFGDYRFQLPDSLVLGVERKDVHDFLNSFGSGRLLKQMSGMVETYTIPYLLLEGSMREDEEGLVIADGGTTGWRMASVRGVLCSIQDSGVRLALSQSRATTIICLNTLHTHYLNEKHLRRFREVVESRAGSTAVL